MILTASCVVVALFAVSGCRSADAMRQRCIAGELDDCEGACKKGVAGEGGCFHAAELHREHAALDLGSPDFRKAVSFFEKSCDGAYADGCLFAAQMIEAPYTVPDGADSDVMPPLIADGEVTKREERLDKACAGGSVTGCKRLGDVLVGKKEERAVEAYEKACKEGREAEQCIAARKTEAALFSRLASSCKRGMADDCTRLGSLLFAVDPPRAMRLFASECELRGAASIEGSAARFVRKRAREAARGVAAEVPVKAAEGKPPFDVEALSVAGQLAVVEADRGLKQHAAALAPCAADLPAAARGSAKLRLTVDRTGDVYRAVVVEGTLPGPASACIAASLENVAFNPLAGGGPATIDALVRTRDAP